MEKQLVAVGKNATVENRGLFLIVGQLLSDLCQQPRF